MPIFLDTQDADFEERFAALLTMKREDSPDVDRAVAEIIADVRQRGDAAVIEMTSKFDRLDLTPETLAISEDEIDAAIRDVPKAEAEALELAAERIRAYHERQLPRDECWTDETGATLGWRWNAVGAAGLYVPGGLASYPSSVLMNAIPAKVAGVERLVMTAPTPDGVPVNTTSPGNRVKLSEIWASRAKIPIIIWPVWPCCRIEPFTVKVKSTC